MKKLDFWFSAGSALIPSSLWSLSDVISWWFAWSCRQIWIFNWKPLFNKFFSCFFQGAGKEIREAISDPSPEIQERAWNVVLPLVEKLKACYEHSLELERIVPKLLSQLVGGRLNPTQHLETQQALVKQLAEILEFVLKFDEYKVSNELRFSTIWNFDLALATAKNINLLNSKFSFGLNNKIAWTNLTLLVSFNQGLNSFKTVFSSLEG